MVKFFRIYPKAINIYWGLCEVCFRKTNEEESSTSPGKGKKSGDIVQLIGASTAAIDTEIKIQGKRKETLPKIYKNTTVVPSLVIFSSGAMVRFQRLRLLC